MTTYLVMYVFCLCYLEGGVMLFPFPMLKWPS